MRDAPSQELTSQRRQRTGMARITSTHSTSRSGISEAREARKCHARTWARARATHRHEEASRFRSQKGSRSKVDSGMRTGRHRQQCGNACVLPENVGRDVGNRGVHQLFPECTVSLPNYYTPIGFYLYPCYHYLNPRQTPVTCFKCCLSFLARLLVSP